MSRKKKPQTLPELYAAKEETENELRKAKQKEKILQNQISKLTRNARTHRLCTRAGMLESFLPNPELLTDEEVMAVQERRWFNADCANFLRFCVRSSEDVFEIL